MVIRECEVDDCSYIQKINTTAFGYEYDLSKTRDNIVKIKGKPTDKLYVACVDNRVVGYVHACDYDCIYSDSLAIAVEENYRRSGIGKLLLNAVENWAKECGCIGIRLGFRIKPD